VLRWVTPTDGVDGFDPAKFVESNDTLVLLSDASANLNVSPLTTMLFQSVVDAAKAYAATCPTGRIDPPLRIVADEVANVAPMPRLPDLASDARGHGIQPIIGLQSLSQAVTRWGREPAETLLTNMAAEIVLGGLSDPTTLARYSTLVGDVEVSEVQLSFEAGGSNSGSSVQRRDKPALRQDEVRRIPRHQALLVYRSMPAVMIRTRPWWEGPRGDELKDHQARIRGLRGVGDDTPTPATTGPTKARRP
jgi:type IV secretory pathway TraG/TraD family ATPase VirD4